MKIHAPTKHLIFCPIFLACLWASHAWALTCLTQSKAVSIDVDWQISGRYRYRFEISNTDDVVSIDHLIQQFNSSSDPVSEYSATIQLPDGRETPWAAIDKNNPPARSLVKIEFTISKYFPGFKGLFADVMQINQSEPVKKATYRITFPEKTNFSCDIIRDNQSNKTTRPSESFSDVFSWSGDNIRHLFLKISTATSWDEISDRYQANFQSRIKNGGAKISHLPRLLADIDTNASDEKKILDVLNFFKTNFDYKRHSQNRHFLLPDDPATVMNRGWGDCKDIALLETLILQSMGIDAFVVLSGIPLTRFSENSIPDPFIFDHAMVGTFANDRITYYDYLAPENIVAANDKNIYLHLKVSYDAQ